MKTKMTLDDRDMKILQILQRDGRITKTELAAKVNLSPAPCWERLKKLEDYDYITGFYANVDIRKIAPVTEVLVQITLSNHRTDDFKRFESEIDRTAEITNCWSISGGVDYMLRLVVADIDAYQSLMESLLEAEIGIEKYFGYVVVKEIKSAPPPLKTA